jgi:hypothetical protein
MRSEIAHRAEFEDFTESSYSELLRVAKRNYRFARFTDRFADHSVLWRHDLDASMHRAVRLAELENAEGVVATYFLFPRCLYYNILNPLTHKLVERIIELGHDIALHFDVTHYSPGLSREALADAIAKERDLLATEFGVQPVAVSFHLYGILAEPIPEDDQICGLINTYSHTLKTTFDYISDSNGVWLYRRLADVLKAAEYPRLQVLTHPEWWTPEAMPPRQRLQRAIDGYADAMGRWYDETVARSGRPNLS